MMLNLFLYICLTGLVTVDVTHVRTVHYKYYLIKTTSTWTNAQSYCREKYTDLATVVTDDDWVRLNKEKGSLTSLTFVGLYKDIIGWRWSLNELPLESVTFSNWGSGEPSQISGNELCALIMGNGFWRAAQYQELHYFICYNESFSGADRFIGITTLLTWPQAQTYCRTHHTDLASALNSSENDFILKVRNIQGDSWIGLYRDTWKFSDGTITSSLKWSSGEPDNAGGVENCAAVSGWLRDVRCTYSYPFVCHTILPVREQQTVRLQVKSDGSVLDPAVQSSILDQVKQKLLEKGMLENTTVTWRVQPDGNIFQKKNKDDL